MNVLENHADNQSGVLYLAMHDLFSKINEFHDRKFFIRCSYIEIYTDLVYDLLQDQEIMGQTLSINEDKKKEFFIKGATEEIITSEKDILEILNKGEENRHYASTIMNHASSRSHTIFRLYI